MGREHWVETLLYNVAVIIMGQSPPSSTYNDKKMGLPFFQGKAEFDETSPIINKYCSQPVRIAEPNDILLSVRAPVGPTNLANTQCCIGRGLAAIRPINGFSISFLLRYFKHIEPWFSKEGTGSTFTAINKDTLTNLEIPLPPLNEQKRIVEKLDDILPKVKSAKTRLEKIPAIMKKFRQSVLAAACSGRLTEDWRKGKDLTRPIIDIKEYRKIIDDVSVDYETHDIPDVWSWQIIDDVAAVKGGKRLPKGTNFSNSITPYPYIMAGALKNGSVLHEKLSYIDKNTQKKIHRYIISGGDIYITIVGACIGDAGIIPQNLNGANLTENALKITDFNKHLYNIFVALWLRSPLAQELIKSTVLSCAQGKLALGRVKAFPVPLPPIEEQHEIVRRVENLFALADSLEKKFNRAMERAEKIEQAILAKAFRGELVEPDSNDEPAEILLQRIVEEKKKLEGGKKIRIK